MAWEAGSGPTWGHHGQDRFGWAHLGLGRLISARSSQLGSAGPGSARLKLARLSSAWFASAWLKLAPLGVARLRLVGLGSAPLGLPWLASARPSLARLGPGFVPNSFPGFTDIRQYIGHCLIRLIYLPMLREVL